MGAGLPGRDSGYVGLNFNDVAESCHPCSSWLEITVDVDSETDESINKIDTDGDVDPDSRLKRCEGGTREL